MKRQRQTEVGTVKIPGSEKNRFFSCNKTKIRNLYLSRFLMDHFLQCFFALEQQIQGGFAKIRSLQDQQILEIPRFLTSFLQ